MIIFRDWTQNLIDGPLQAWKEWILNRTYLLFGGRHFEIIRFPSVLCRPIQNCFKSEIPAKAPLTVPGRCYLCLMLSNTPHTGAKMTTKNRENRPLMPRIPRVWGCGAFHWLVHYSVIFWFSEKRTILANNNITCKLSVLCTSRNRLVNVFE